MPLDLIPTVFDNLHICLVTVCYFFVLLSIYALSVLDLYLQIYVIYRFFSFFLRFRHEGLGGFYKGLVPNLIRVVPATAITFVTYEKVSHFIKQLRD